MANQSAARLKGDRYQHLHSWYEILTLLDDACPFVECQLEHPEAGAADDLVMQPAPGGAAVPRYVQVKFHVDQAQQYSFESLVVGAGGISPVLPKLFKAWRRLSADAEIEIWLVSNWSLAPRPNIGQFVRDSHNLHDTFFDQPLGPAARDARDRWATVLGAVNQDELTAFCRSLRFDVGARSHSTLERYVDDRMRSHGLATGADARAKVYDEIAQQLIDGGGTALFTKASVLKMIEDRSLRRQEETEPKVAVWIHAWERQQYDGVPTRELDWTPYFGRAKRAIAPDDIWQQALLPDLTGVRAELVSRRDGKFVAIRGKMPLTVALAVGSTLPTVGGFSLQIEQPTGGKTGLWVSHAGPSEMQLTVEEEIHGETGAVLVFIAISGTARAACLDLARQLGVSRSVYAEPSAGPGEAALRSASDAVALAVEARRILQDARAQYGPGPLHLVLYAPVGFALFLGQRLNALGDIVLYERSAEGGYQQSIRIASG